MAYERSMNHLEIVKNPPCIHLRSKEIYVTGNPDPVDPAEAGGHRYNCWCNKTQHVVGLDEEVVDRSTCIAGRVCFVPRP